MITNIVTGLVIIVGATLLYYVVAPLLASVQSGNKQSVFYTVLSIAQTVVNALQQEIQGEDKGTEKKAKAVATVKEILARDFNINVSDELIDKAIEAAVFLMKKTNLIEGSEATEELKNE